MGPTNSTTKPGRIKSPSGIINVTGRRRTRSRAWVRRLCRISTRWSATASAIGAPEAVARASLDKSGRVKWAGVGESEGHTLAACPPYHGGRLMGDFTAHEDAGKIQG